MKRSLALALLAGLLLSGCQTPIARNVSQGRAFDRMNEQLFDLYHAKIEASGSEDPILYEDVRSRLADLSEQAVEQAVAAAPKLADQVGFYRIAAVAAWQAGTSAVLDAVDEGRKLCDENPQGWDVAPRDCGLIAVSRDLAVADAASLQVKELATSFPGHANDVPNAEEAKLVALIRLLISRHDLLARTVTSVQASQAPEAFALRSARARDVTACNAATAWTLLSRVVDADVRSANALKDEIDARRPASGCD